MDVDKIHCRVYPERNSISPFDRYGSRTYSKTCYKLGQTPIGVVKRGLRSSVLDVSGRGLDTRATLAICNALTVSTLFCT